MIRLTAKQKEFLVLQFKQGISINILRVEWNLSREEVERFIREALKKEKK